MRKFPLYALLVLVLFQACQENNKEDLEVEPLGGSELQTLMDDYYEGTLALNPIKSTFAGKRDRNHEFPNFLSDAYKDSARAFYDHYKTELSKFDDDNLNQVEQMSKSVLMWECEMNLKELNYRKELFPIDQMWSVNLVMGQLASGSSAQPFETVEDYENWLKRVDAYIQWIRTAEERMKEGARIRYVLPSSLILKIIPQLKSMVTESAEAHLFYSPINQFPTDFNQEDKDRLTAAYKDMISNRLVPAYDSLHRYVSTDYLNEGRTSSGVDAIPNGSDYYAFAIKKYTTTDLSAEEIHELGLKEVERILGEMEAVRQEVGFDGDLKDFFDHLRKKKELMPFDRPEQVLDHFNGIHEVMKPQLEKLFLEKPETEFIVKQTEAFREASSSAEYNPGSLDGTRPGVFYVPIPDASAYNIVSDEALFLHEAIPGHHYQISLQQENDSLPDFRKTLWYSAYGEGWALYAESLGKELGLYTDPYQYFGMLSSEMHRAIRLVVDTGLHAKGWTREQAIQYSLENEAEPEASIISEIERYMANPGQALSYKIGQLKIIELRNKAENALGDRFDIGDFHKEVLETGCIPLSLLEAKIEQWMIEVKASGI